MYLKLLSGTVSQEAPQKANAVSEFIKTQPVLFGLIIVVSLLVISSALIAAFVIKNKKRKK